MEDSTLLWFQYFLPAERGCASQILVAASIILRSNLIIRESRSNWGNKGISLNLFRRVITWEDFLFCDVLGDIDLKMSWHELTKSSHSYLEVFSICVIQHVFLMMGPDTSLRAAWWCSMQSAGERVSHLSTHVLLALFSLSARMCFCCV